MPAVKKWFKVRKYGYGWTPQTFEGYLTTIIYFVLFATLTIIFIMRLGDPLFDQRVSVGIYLCLVGVLSISLVVIAYLTGEKPSWNWGNKSSKSSKN